MAAMQGGDSPPRTPPPSLAAEMGATPPPAPRPLEKKRRRRGVSYTAKLLFNSVEELRRVLVEEDRKWQSSEEALAAQRKRKLRVLMSLR